MDVFVCRTQRPKYMKHTNVCDWSRYTIVCGFPGGSDSKASACNVGDLGSTPGLGRSPGEGKGYPLQYSGLENSMKYIVHGVTESDMTEWLFTLSFEEQQTAL